VHAHDPRPADRHGHARPRGGRHENGACPNLAGWERYWGTASPVVLDFSAALPAAGIKHERREENGYVVNEGNEATIEPEIVRKVPLLLAKGRYFPNGDHGIQPPVTFEGLRRFMTLLHEVCGNPEGEFPRV